MATLYENIVGLCEERGIKPGKAAVDINVSKSIMTRLKKDPSSTIDTQTAQKLAEYFGVSLDRVLYGVKEKPALNNENGLSAVEVELLRYFKMLNETGKQTALERIKELSEISRFTEDTSSMVAS